MLLLRPVLVLLLFLLFPRPPGAYAVGAETLTYVLTPQPDDGRLLVEITWQTEGRTDSALCLSERLGSAENLPRLVASLGIGGASLEGRDGGCWNMRHRAGAAIRVRYAVAPPARVFDWSSVDLPVTTVSFFFGVGHAFLLVPRPGYGGAPAEYETVLRWKLPAGWRAVCSWGAGTSVGDRLAVEDLRHSAYFAGELAVARSEPGEEQEVVVATLKRFKFDAVDLLGFVRQTVDAQCNFFGEKKFPLFVVVAVPVGDPVADGRLRASGSGLYHSVAVFAPPESPITEGMKQLVAHEAFHFWNGRILKPEEPEQLTSWFTEGFTDYYAARLLLDSGQWSEEVFCRWVNQRIRDYCLNPARDAKNERIRQMGSAERDTVGEVPYQRGLLLGIRWNRMARDRGVREGVDKLMLALVDRARTRQERLSNRLVREEGAKSLGEWFEQEIERYVERAEPIELPENALEPRFVGEVGQVFGYELGFDRVASLRDRRVSGLIAASAAAAAGLRDGDELTAWSLPATPDEEVLLKIRREGETVTIHYHPRGKKLDAVQFRPAASSGDGR